MSYETVEETIETMSILQGWIEICEQGKDDPEDVLGYYHKHFEVLNSQECYEEMYSAVCKSRYWEDYYREYC